MLRITIDAVQPPNKQLNPNRNEKSFRNHPLIQRSQEIPTFRSSFPNRWSKQRFGLPKATPISWWKYFGVYHPQRLFTNESNLNLNKHLPKKGTTYCTPRAHTPVNPVANDKSIYSLLVKVALGVFPEVCCSTTASMMWRLRVWFPTNVKYVILVMT